MVVQKSKGGANMSVFMYLVHKIADGGCEDSEIQFAYDYGAITESERRKLYNLKNNLFFGYYTVKTLKEKLDDLLASDELSDDAAFSEQKGV